MPASPLPAPKPATVSRIPRRVPGAFRPVHADPPARIEPSYLALPPSLVARLSKPRFAPGNRNLNRKPSAYLAVNFKMRIQELRSLATQRAAAANADIPVDRQLKTRLKQHKQIFESQKEFLRLCGLVEAQDFEPLWSSDVPHNTGLGPSHLRCSLV